MTELPLTPDGSAAARWSCPDTASDTVHGLTDALNALIDYVQDNRIDDPDVLHSVKSLACHLCIHAGGGNRRCEAVCHFMKNSIH